MGEHSVGRSVTRSVGHSVGRPRPRLGDRIAIARAIDDGTSTPSRARA